MPVDIKDSTIDWQYRDLIPEVREIFIDDIKDLQEDEPDAVYQEDVDKIMEEDYWVERFLEYYLGDVEGAAEGIVRSLEIQKEYRLRDLKDEDLPSEFFSTGHLFKYEEDKLGRPTLYSRAGRAANVRQLKEMGKQIGLYIQYKMTRDSGEKGHICISDFEGAEVGDIDVGAITGSMELLSVFPNSVSMMICVNIPHAVRTLLNSVLYMMPEHQKKCLVILSSPEELQEVIDIDKIPDFLGGTCSRPYKGQELVPHGCRSAREMFGSMIKDLKSNDNENNNEVEIVKSVDSALMLPDKIDRATAKQLIDQFEEMSQTSLLE